MPKLEKFSGLKKDCLPAAKEEPGQRERGKKAFKETMRGRGKGSLKKGLRLLERSN